MTFSTAQIRKLQQNIKEGDIRTREVNGKELSYIEGWYAISEANRIFGFDAWNRETLESRCIIGRENRGTFHALYVTKVRVTVRAEEHTVIREGYGTGEAHGSSAGEAHEKAIKTAETDATKRALATFGKPFGLALYVGTRQRQALSDRRPQDIARRRTLQKLDSNRRYYVPAQPQPNPSHATTLLAASLPPDRNEQNSKNDPAQSATVPALAAKAQQGLSELPKADPTAAPKDSFHDGTMGRLLIDRPRRRRDADHLRFVAAQPCLICSRTPSDAHHLKFAQPSAMSKKVSDEYTVPLCRTHHRQLHHGGDEIAWWIDLDIDPLPIAQDLWVQSRGRNAIPIDRENRPNGALHDDEKRP
ncbi:RAD52 family DNA repair protein [Pseudorhodoplanes sinuspersici]|uniref:Uncharacterized protein n=1 Tax=Pseudorhodoplanes sinuspersici TaxID=1235591 RepID=A0A1W7A012_9HYPH|nr:Rad52/Rad22 family DNA repair protein [Pseudorhodoplanes sinuspersici]ARQ02345.1 hypothetical protein CAK95_26995 [Pseudorhodoplanes sinuspersici]RKE74172.1 uncharacterized protein DUF968 [Pseudorhodoplanes sinuspersici]